MKKASIGHSEATVFIIVMTGTKVLLGYPRLVTEVGFNAGWLISLLSGLISIGFWLVISSILNRFPGKSLAEITEIILGPVLGLIANVIVVLYVLFGTSNLVRLFSEAVILTSLTETPLSILALLLILGTWIAAYYGLEAITRSAYIFFPFIALSIVVVLIALYPYYDFKQFLPFLGSGALPVLKYSFLGTSAFGEVISLAYLAGYFAFGPEKLKKIGALGLFIVTLFFVAIVGAYLMVLPFPTSFETYVPIYQLSRSIFLGHYFQRVEAVFVIFWTFMAFLRLSAGIMVVAVILQDTLKLPYYRPLLPALCLLTFSLSLTPIDLIETMKLEGQVRMVYGWLVAFVLPLLIWGTALLLRKGDNKRTDAKS